MEPSSAKRRRRTSSEGKLLCVCCYRRRASLSKGFDIYLVDLNSAENSVGDSISPTLFVDYFDVFNACVLGSTLYLFRSGDEWDGDPDCAGRLTPVATVDLFNYRNMKNVELDDSMVRYIKPMRHPKRFPGVSATPGGKILVLSTQILFNPPDAGVDRPNDFELYDPATDEWEQLPQLHERLERGRKISCFDSITVKSFVFRSESVLVVTTEIGMFELDLESCGGGWQDCLAACKIPSSFGFHYLSGIEGELCFTHDFVFDVDIPMSMPICCQFPPVPLYNHDDYEPPMALATIQPSGCGREVLFCRVQAALNKRSKRPPRMDIQVFKCDIARYREELKKKQHVQDNVGPIQLPVPHVQLSVRLEKSLEFVLETRRCSVFIPQALSYLSFGTDRT